MGDAAGKTDNAVMKGLAGATMALAAVNAYDAVQSAANAKDATQIDKVGGVSIKLSRGTSKSSSTTDRNASNAFGSTIAAGNDLTIVAQGAGKDSDITVTGSIKNRLCQLHIYGVRRPRLGARLTGVSINISDNMLGRFLLGQ